MKIISFVTAGLLLCAMAQAGEPGKSLGRKYSTLERMSAERLAAEAADVARIQAGRQDVDRSLGLTDRRAIAHAHAQDSAHTGGTLPEMLEDAKKAGVSIVLLSNHHRPPFDFIDDNWRGLHDGVLFIPGSETNGYLVHPMKSVMSVMSKSDAEIVAAVTQGEGLIFLSHIEERFDHPMDGLSGMEIYNRHADAKDDMGIFAPIVAALTDPKKLAEMSALVEKYPDEMLATQLDYPELYLRKWDQETPARRLTGVAANDCHHNQVFVSKMVDAETVLVGTIVDPDNDMRTFTAKQYPGIVELTKGHQPGDIVAKLDFDPYYRSMRNASTHILTNNLTEEAVRAALHAGHAYVSHDWMCDATGFYFAARHADDAASAAPRAVMGDEIKLGAGLQLVAEFPAEGHIRLIRNGQIVQEVDGRELTHDVKQAGVYRMEGFLTVDGEMRSWIYSNPIYVRD
jgi:hypothetical protein